VLKGLIFDLDGTLANTLEDLTDSMNRVLSREGFPTHRREAYRYFVGAGVRNLVKRSLPEDQRGDAIVDRCFDLMMADYRENCFVKTHLYDGIAETIDGLRTRGIKLAVFSNKLDELTQRFVEVLIGAEKFEMIIGAQHSIPIKPDPTGALLISKRLGIPPHSMGYIGDTSTDMITANDAGMFAIGALWGFRTKEELIESGAKKLLSHPLELLDLF
jgi:phosphoglycolate phosphatase